MRLARPRGAVDRPRGLDGGVNEEGAVVAVADLIARGGVLGEQIEMITADGYFDGAQAVAAAHKLDTSIYRPFAEVEC